MTPFQKLGYNVGDRFKHTGKGGTSRKELIGKVFELIKDDGSVCPYFHCLSNLSMTKYPQHYTFCFDAGEITLIPAVEANE
jgi:hypothetical protein